MRSFLVALPRIPQVAGDTAAALINLIASIFWRVARDQEMAIFENKNVFVINDGRTAAFEVL